MQRETRQEGLAGPNQQAGLGAIRWPAWRTETIVSEHSESVKHVAGLLRASAEQANKSGDIDKAVERLALAEKLESAAKELVRLAGLTSALPPSLGNIHDLPQELLDELSVTKTDELEDQLVTVVNAHDGQADLDQLLVGLYRKFGVKQKRRFLQNKLYRMAKNDLIWVVPGRKGVYSTKEPEAHAQDTLEEALPDDIDEVPF